MGGSRKKQRDAADQMIFDQGRTARAGSIGRDDAPYADSKQKDLWLEGWDFEDENRGGRRD